MKISEIYQQLLDNNSTNAKITLLKSLINEPKVVLFFKNMYSEEKLGISTKTLPSITKYGDKIIEDTIDELLEIMNDLRIRKSNKQGINDEVKSKLINFISQHDEVNANILLQFFKAIDRKLILGKKNLLKAGFIESINPKVMKLETLSKDTIKYIDFDKATIQTKYDGFRLIADLTGDEVIYYSSIGNTVENLNLDLQPNQDIILDGELICFDETTNKYVIRQVSNGYINKLNKSGTELPKGVVLHYVVFDCLQSTEELMKGTEEHYNSRFDRLTNYINKVKPKNVMVIETTNKPINLDIILDYYKKAIHDGEEGIIIKNWSSPYQPNKRTRYQLKVKVEKEVELKIVSWNYGNGKYKDMIGSLNCVSDDGKVEVSVSGLTDELRESLKSEVGKICTVKANALIKSRDRVDKSTLSKESGKYSLFLPRFVELRYDSEKANNFTEIEKIFNSFDFNSLGE